MLQPPTPGPALALVLTLILSAAPAATGAPVPAPVIAHHAEVVLDVQGHTVKIVDRMMIPAGLDHLRLGPDLVVEQILRTDFEKVDPLVALSTAEDEDGPFQRLSCPAMGLGDNGGFLMLIYGGSFFESVEDVVFSRENVGGEITATISEEGIYLSSGSGWLAGNPDALATFDLELDTPAGFETVTQGRRTAHAGSGDRLHTRWTAVHPSDGLNLIANRFVVSEDPIREGLISYTFLLEDDPDLRDKYLERTRAYIRMYEEMIGPYPYAKFATVENWFPTGYGMPSWTLLGGQVLRLPFIPYTSFGHEIAHNWWGNSVFVDLDEGNWCEGLTSWCADYHYKELESPEAAREYRRNLLKDYAGYVHDPAQDFPLSEFKNRHSGATRAVGYGKSMMVFHMIDRLVGREGFLAALQEVAAEHQYLPAAWSDFLAAFSRSGGLDLGYFTGQWLTRTGAPRLELQDVRFAADRISLTITQPEPAYRLMVPVVVTTSAGPQEHLVEVSGLTTEVELEARGALRVAVDPDCQLFRHLHDQEIEPTLRQILARRDVTVVTGDTDSAGEAAARGFGAGFTEQEGFPFADDGQLPPAGAAVLINPGPAVFERLRPAELFVSGKTVVLQGKRFSLEDFDLVFAAADPEDPGLTHLVVLCRVPGRLEGLAGRLGHYGKYSWLLLPAGKGSVERGNWAAGASPLVAEKR